MITIPPKILIDRIIFLCNNFRMFRCESVFFQTHIVSLDVIKKENVGKYLKYFYVVEPLPMKTLADYAIEKEITEQFFLDSLPNLLNTLSGLQSVKFPYLSLSPFTIVVEDGLWLRPPSLSPFSSPKSQFAPAPKTSRGSFRSVDEMRFYRSPEWNVIPPFWQADCWSLATIICEYLLFKGPMFGSTSDIDQMIRTQNLLGMAPRHLGWIKPSSVNPITIHPILKRMLNYDPLQRPVICVHFSIELMVFVKSMKNIPSNICIDPSFDTDEEEEFAEESVYESENIDANRHNDLFVSNTQEFHPHQEESNEKHISIPVSISRPEIMKDYSSLSQNESPSKKTILYHSDIKDVHVPLEIPVEVSSPYSYALISDVSYSQKAPSINNEVPKSEQIVFSSAHEESTPSRNNKRTSQSPKSEVRPPPIECTPVSSPYTPPSIKSSSSYPSSELKQLQKRVENIEKSFAKSKNNIEQLSKFDSSITTDSSFEGLRNEISALNKRLYEYRSSQYNDCPGCFTGHDVKRALKRGRDLLSSAMED